MNVRSPRFTCPTPIPDEEGIETDLGDGAGRHLTVRHPYLMKKVLRLSVAAPTENPHRPTPIPDEEGIETSRRPRAHRAERPTPIPDEEGIET